jgi:hypothetical protein
MIERVSRRVIALAALGEILLCGAAPSAPAETGAVVTLTLEKSVLTLPDNVECVDIGVTVDGQSKSGVPVSLLAEGPRNRGFGGAATTGADGHGRACITLESATPEQNFVFAGTWAVTAYTSSLGPFTANTATFEVVLPRPAPPAPQPPPGPAKSPHSLAVTGSVSFPKPESGQPLAYTLTVSNDGVEAAPDVHVSIEAPSPLVGAPAIEAQALFAGIGTCSLPMLTCSIGLLRPGEATTVKLSARSATYLPITLQANVTAGQLGNPDSIERGFSVSTNSGPARADLVLEAPRSLTMKLGRTSRVLVRLRNDGPGVAVGSSFKIVLPAGVRTVTCGDAACGTTVALPDLEAGQTASVAVTLKATKTGGPRPLRFVLMLNPNVDDPAHDGNAATVLVTTRR